jgi:hypothetical protein
MGRAFPWPSCPAINNFGDDIRGTRPLSDNSLLERVAAAAEDSHLTLEFASGQIVSRMNARSPFHVHLEVKRIVIRKGGDAIRLRALADRVGYFGKGELTVEQLKAENEAFLDAIINYIDRGSAQ